MIRKTLAISLVLMIIGLMSVFAMTGCSSDQESAAAEAENTAVTEEMATEEPLIDASEALGDNQNEDVISEDKAKIIALEDAGFSESDVEYLNVVLDRDDGRTEYDIDFQKGELEYEYTLDAVTGDILESETDSIYD